MRRSALILSAFAFALALAFAVSAQRGDRGGVVAASAPGSGDASAPAPCGAHCLRGSGEVRPLAWIEVPSAEAAPLSLNAAPFSARLHVQPDGGTNYQCDATITPAVGCAVPPAGHRVKRVIVRTQPGAQPTAMPSPVPTRSPTPTAAPPCTDGSFRAEPGGTILSLGSKQRPAVLEPGRVHEFCATVPATMKAPAGFLETFFVNWSNVSCNIYSMWVTSPSGKVAESLGQSAPKPMLRHEFGKWRVQLWLDPSLDSRCRDRVTRELVNPGLQINWWAF